MDNVDGPMMSGKETVQDEYEKKGRGEPVWKEEGGGSLQEDELDPGDRHKRLVEAVAAFETREGLW
jgi:hypothetical protein